MEVKKTKIFFPTKKHPVFGWNVEDNKKIGEPSVYGNIYKICKQNNCDYVIKIILNSTHKEIKKEVKIQKLCAKHNICKPVEDWWLFKGRSSFHPENLFIGNDSIFVASGGVIITEILEETYRERVNKEKDEKELRKLLKKTWKLLLRLHQIGIIHNDPHSGNLMFDKKGKLFLIDMGESIEMLDNFIEGKYYLNKIIEDYKQISLNTSSNLKEYYRIVVVILNKYINYFMDKQNLSLNGAEKEAVNKILKMKDEELDKIVENYGVRRSVCTIL